MMALHIIGMMFPKPHFIHHVEPAHTKSTYSKLHTPNWPPSIETQNEVAIKLRTFLKIRPHNHLFEYPKKNCVVPNDSYTNTMMAKLR